MEKFVFFGGKGGVGKTTMSAAYALKCVDAGQRTLVVSTDPAHSISDVFDQQFDDEPRAVEGVEDLWAMEIDPEEEISRHMQEIKRTMADQVSPAIVNEIDAQIELAHQTPGAHEAALFDRFIDVMRNAGEFDRVVFDTSPTGGTLRLLSLPEFLESWVERLLKKREHSVDLFDKAAIGDREPAVSRDEDPIIARLFERKEMFEYAGETLRNDAAFFLVVNPDELSIRETRRAIETLEGHDLPLHGLVINKVTPAPDDEEGGRGATFLRNRVATERDRIETIRESFDVPVAAVIEWRVEEVKGSLLHELAAELDVEVAATA